MPFVTLENFELVQKALADNPEALAALVDGRADDGEIEEARALHASDEVEIDDDATASHGDDGYWVSAWVFVPVESNEEEDEDDE